MIPDGTTSAGRGSESAKLSELELTAWRGMLRTTHAVRQELGTVLQTRHGLSMADYDALVALADHGAPMRMTALADAILQPRSSLTRIVGSLEDRSLVTRGTVEGDGRGATVRLTAPGRRLFVAAHRSHLLGVRRLFLDRVSTAQLRALAAVWRAVGIDP